MPGLNTMSATTTIGTTTSTRDSAYEPPDPVPDVRLGGCVGPRRLASPVAPTPAQGSDTGDLRRRLRQSELDGRGQRLACPGPRMSRSGWSRCST